jgi:hypothetical protein
VDDLLIANDGDVTKAIAQAEEMNREWARKQWKPAIDFLRSAKVEARTAVNTYTVNLEVEPEELLDWDKPLSQQGAKVKAAL